MYGFGEKVYVIVCGVGVEVCVEVGCGGDV